jgi:signal transduction histidine kinase
MKRMDTAADRLLQSVRRLCRAGRTEVAVTDGRGHTIVGRLDPPLEAVSQRAGERQPIAATLLTNDGTVHALMLLPLGSADAAVAVDPTPLLEHVDLAVEALVNHIAHDVRNLAFTIGLQAELGERRDAPPEVTGHFTTVLKQVDALKEYLDRLLLYGRRPRLEPRPHEVARLLHQWAAEFSFSRREDGGRFDIRVEESDGAGQARWDAALLAKGFAELLDNAVRSGDPAPPVTITVSGEPTRVHIEVRDRGRGIPDDVLALMATPMGARRPGGAGLGVAIARKLIRAHGGTLSHRSDRTGTAAVVDLPREVPSD